MPFSCRVDVGLILEVPSPMESDEPILHLLKKQAKLFIRLLFKANILASSAHHSDVFTIHLAVNGANDVVPLLIEPSNPSAIPGTLVILPNSHHEGLALFFIECCHWTLAFLIGV